MTTRARERYLASRRNQATMEQVERLLERDSSLVLQAGRGFSQQEMGGFLRTVVPGLVDRYGNINATAAMQYYDQQRLAWLSTPAGQRYQDPRRASQRAAAARTRAAIYVSRMPSFDAPALSEPIIGLGMKTFMKTGFEAMEQEVTRAMTRAVASYNRDTMLYNASLDDAVYAVQRVAEPNACGFCQLVAFESAYQTTEEGVRTASYAIDFHNNCKCSIETLYLGDRPIRPDYYDQFEQNYQEATADGTSDAISNMNRIARSN